MIIMPDSGTPIPGSAIESRSTKAVNAWTAVPLTIQLYAPLEAIRVSSRRLDLLGDWFAIGDCVQTRSQYQASRALPKSFKFVALCLLRPGTVINVGRCSALFGQPGEGEQAEFIEGPLPCVHPLDAIWSDRIGHA